MDFIKAYDRIDETYLRFILLQFVLEIEITNWIMACITYARFVVLINGSLTGFFTGNGGSIQGFPLFPYIFILVIEGLSLINKEEKK